jgi:hypothetical protein
MCIVGDLVYQTFADSNRNVTYFHLLIPASMKNALLKLVHCVMLYRLIEKYGSHKFMGYGPIGKET